MIIGVYVLIIDLPKMKNENEIAVVDSSKNTLDISTDNTTEKQNIDTSTNQEIKESQTAPQDKASNSNSTTTTPATSTPTPTPAPTTPATPTYSFKDGSFTSSKSYAVPGSKTNTLTATITISNDSVISISTSSVNDPRSQEYNDDFKAEIAGSVVSKKIDGLSVGAVGGASLTSEAFNQILNQIRNLAKK